MIKKFISIESFAGYVEDWKISKPFNNIVLNDFLDKDIATAVSNEFPDFEDQSWRIYNNAIEIKKLQNHWDKFGPVTYKLFQFLNSYEFISKLECLTCCELFPDFGLNGGGLHTHKLGGKLNTHLDYSVHPKLGLERRLNLLIYVTPNWSQSWGGDLGLWAVSEDGKGPGALVSTISPKFNRAVLFDTTQDSWHGLPEPIKCPENVTRNSLAVYYLCYPRDGVDTRGKALFSPYKDQVNNQEVLDLIQKRSSVGMAANVYGDKKN